MLNWLANKLATRLQREDRQLIEAALADIRKERDDARREVRSLISEMEDVLEKFSRVVARQAMRRSRAMKNALEEEPEPQAAAAETVAEPAPNGPDDLRARKAAVRARIAGRINTQQRHGT